MKSVLFLIAISVVTTAVRCSSLKYGTGGYVQKSKGNATFTVYTGCSTPGKFHQLRWHAPINGIHIACGKASDGYSAAINQLSFGAPGGGGAGDACGRCFRITATEDPYSPWYEGPFKTIVVMATNLCPYQKGEPWCGQSLSTPLNQFGASMQ